MQEALLLETSGRPRLDPQHPMRAPLFLCWWMVWRCASHRICLFIFSCLPALGLGVGAGRVEYGNGLRGSTPWALVRKKKDCYYHYYYYCYYFCFYCYFNYYFGYYCYCFCYNYMYHYYF